MMTGILDYLLSDDSKELRDKYIFKIARPHIDPSVKKTDLTLISHPYRIFDETSYRRTIGVCGHQKFVSTSIPSVPLYFLCDLGGLLTSVALGAKGGWW